MAESKSIAFTVVAANSLAQQGRFLEVGETVEIEEHVARAEFEGRLAYPDGTVVKKRTLADELNEFVAAVEPRRAHERVSMITEKLKTFPAGAKVRPPLEAMLAAAQKEAADDQARHTARLSDTPKPAAPTPPEVPTKPSTTVKAHAVPAVMPASEDPART